MHQASACQCGWVLAPGPNPSCQQLSSFLRERKIYMIDDRKHSNKKVHDQGDREVQNPSGIETMLPNSLWLTFSINLALSHRFFFICQKKSIWIVTSHNLEPICTCSIFIFGLLNSNIEVRHRLHHWNWNIFSSTLIKQLQNRKSELRTLNLGQFLRSNFEW